MADSIGTQLGNYKLIKLIGEGAFARVYLGEHVHLGTQAAIKVLYSAQQLTAEDIRKFTTEARTIARLIHPHIVRVLEFGVEGKTLYLVMDYAPNGTLRQRHTRGVPIPLGTVVKYVRQAANGLQYAHDNNLIHRDVKPENMLIDQRNEILLSDFGIAVVAQTSRNARTQDMAGTITYMAPEQINKHPRPASDQYSLAVIAFEWLTGELPFQGLPYEVMGKHVQAEPPSLRDKLSTIPVSVEKVIHKALAKDPHDRFSTVSAFADELEKVARENLARLTRTPPPRVYRALPRRSRPIPEPDVVRRSRPIPELDTDDEEYEDLDPDVGFLFDEEESPRTNIPAVRLNGPPTLHSYRSSRAPVNRDSTIPPRRTQRPAAVNRLPSPRVEPVAYRVDEEENSPPIPIRQRSISPRRTRPIAPPARKSTPRVHWLLPVGAGMTALLVLWILASAILAWGTDNYNDLRYGRPRTYQTDAVVGHGGDSPQHPSHFTAYNFDRQVVVVEFPAGDPTRSVVYLGPVLIQGPNGNLIPVTLEFRSVTPDHRIDMLIHVHEVSQDEVRVFVNDGTKFRPATANDHVHL